MSSRCRKLERLAGRPPAVRTGTRLSARNRLAGVVRSVKADGVMAVVEIQAGPYLLAAAITADAVEELALVLLACPSWRRSRRRP